MTTFTVSGTVASYYVGPGNYLTVTSAGAVLAHAGAAGSGGASHGSYYHKGPPPSGGYGGAGSDGDTAVETVAATLDNSGTIRGGAGGYGGFGGYSHYAFGHDLSGGAGGSGGAAATLSGGLISNNGVIIGGAGGQGGVGAYAGYYYYHYSSKTQVGGPGGIGGAGNAGLTLSNSASATNSGIILGGAGGHGGQGGLGHYRGSTYGVFGHGGGGGVGGDGASIAASDLTNKSTITGGAGGSAGGGNVSYGVDTGLGGAGGVGVVMTSGVLDNQAFIYGGQGGTSANESPFGLGGAGGDGVSMTGGYLLNNGIVSGGPGGGGAGGHDRVSGVGVECTDGTITNQAGATITGYGSTAAYVSGGDGVILTDGQLFNFGTIEGGTGALHAFGGTGVVLYGGYLENTGLIAGGGQGWGISSQSDGGDIVNRAGATITGTTGVRQTNSGPLTVINEGAIDGASQSVEFTSKTDLLVVASGATFSGKILGGQGTLDLAGGTGTITGLGGTATLSGTVSAEFQKFDVYEIEESSAWTASGGGTLLDSQAIVVGSGSTLTVTSGALTSHGSIELGAKGTLVGDGGVTLTNDGSISGGGVIFGPLFVSNTASGVIDDATGTMIINNQYGAGLSNSGLIESKGTGDLGLKAVTVSGGGSITDDREMKLIGATIDGGGVSVAAGAVFEAVTTAVNAIGAATSVTDAGAFDIVAKATLVNDGTIASTGAGVIQIDSILDDSAGGQVIADGRLMTLSGGSIQGGGLSVGAGSVLDTAGKGGTINLVGGTVINAGKIEGDTGGLTIDGSVQNNYLIEAVGAGSLTITGPVTGTGTALISASATLTLDGDTNEAVLFAAGSTGELVLGASSDITGAISGLSKTGANRIDLEGVAWNTSNTVSFSGSKTGGVLTIFNSASVAVATLSLKGDYLGSAFTLASDGAGGTLVTDPPATLAQAMAGFATGGSISSGSPTHASATTAPTLASPSG